MPVNLSCSLRRILVMAALALAPQAAAAQSNPSFIAFSGTTKGALYRPDSGPAPHVGILVMHRTANYLAHRACTELSRRGFLMLCMNTRYENNEALVDFEKLPLDVRNGVDFLRKQARDAARGSHLLTPQRCCLRKRLGAVAVC